MWNDAPFFGKYVEYYTEMQVEKISFKAMQ